MKDKSNNNENFKNLGKIFKKNDLSSLSKLNIPQTNVGKVDINVNVNPNVTRYSNPFDSNQVFNVNIPQSKKIEVQQPKQKRKIDNTPKQNKSFDLNEMVKENIRFRKKLDDVFPETNNNFFSKMKPDLKTIAMKTTRFMDKNSTKINDLFIKMNNSIKSGVKILSELVSKARNFISTFFAEIGRDWYYFGKAIVTNFIARISKGKIRAIFQIIETPLRMVTFPLVKIKNFIIYPRLEFYNIKLSGKKKNQNKALSLFKSENKDGKIKSARYFQKMGNKKTKVLYTNFFLDSINPNPFNKNIGRFQKNMLAQKIVSSLMKNINSQERIINYLSRKLNRTPTDLKTTLTGSSLNKFDILYKNLTIADLKNMGNITDKSGMLMKVEASIFMGRFLKLAALGGLGYLGFYLYDNFKEEENVDSVETFTDNNSEISELDFRRLMNDNIIDNFTDDQIELILNIIETKKLEYVYKQIKNNNISKEVYDLANENKINIYKTPNNILEIIDYNDEERNIIKILKTIYDNFDENEKKAFDQLLPEQQNEIISEIIKNMENNNSINIKKKPNNTILIIILTVSLIAILTFMLIVFKKRY